MGLCLNLFRRMKYSFVPVVIKEKRAVFAHCITVAPLSKINWGLERWLGG